MNCMNCGALLTDTDYCPHCGCDVMVQKKAFYLANLYYNQGLEKPVSVICPGPSAVCGGV